MRAEKRGQRLQTSTERRGWTYLRPQDLLSLKNMLFAAQTVVEGYYAGKHKSPFRGSAPEFADYRQYQPGDELRGVDWKVYARSDRQFIKLYEKETDLSCTFVLDASASMAYAGQGGSSVRGETNCSKLQYANFLVAALAFLIVKQGDKAGLTIFDDEVREHVPAGGTFAHLYRILSLLENCKAGKRTSLPAALQKVYALQKRRGLLVVVSDFVDDPEKVFAALNLFRHRGFEIILFHVLHEYEWRLPSVANAQFVDAESRSMLTCAPEDIRASYAKAMDEFRDTYSTMAMARGITYQFMDTSTPYNKGIERFLTRRQGLRM